MKCSYCGSDALVIKDEILELSEPFSRKGSITIKVVKCNTCGFEEDDVNNDLVIQEELALLKQSSMVNILNYLNENGCTNASMERALGLPARTLARWKNESTIFPSAAALALMRIVRTFPWMLQVADCQFDKEKTRSIFLSHATTELTRIKSQIKYWDVSTRTYTSENDYVFAVRYSREAVPVTDSGNLLVYDNLNMRCVNEN